MKPGLSASSWASFIYPGGPESYLKRHDGGEKYEWQLFYPGCSLYYDSNTSVGFYRTFKEEHKCTT